jgi:hypothetical protein
MRRRLLIITKDPEFDMRGIQEGCIGIDDPAAVRKRVMDMRMILIKSVTETVAVGANKSQMLTDREPTKELEPLRSADYIMGEPS